MQRSQLTGPLCIWVVSREPLDLLLRHDHEGEPTSARSAVFLNIVQKAFDPPPFVLNIMLQIFFDGFLKKRVNVCRDKIRQNNA